MSVEILKRHFSEPELQTLEQRPEYAETVRKIEQMQADAQLDQLEQRVNNNISTAQSLEERWEVFKSSLSQTDTPNENGAIQSQDQESITSESKIEDLEAELRENISSQWAIKGALLGWVIDWVKESEENIKNQNGIEKIFWELWLKIGIALLTMFGGKEIYDSYKQQKASIFDSVDSLVNTASDSDIPTIEISKETRDTVKYEAGIKMLLFLSEGENINTRSLLYLSEVQDTSYENIISPNFKISDQSEGDISTLQTVLKEQESFINSILKETPDWKKLTLLEIFEQIGIYGPSFLHINNFSAQDILDWKFRIGNFSIAWNGEIWGDLIGLYEKLASDEASIFHGVSHGLLLQIFSEKDKKIQDTDVESLLSGNTFDSEKDTNFEKNFVTFWRNFIDIIQTHFFLGKEEYRSAFQEYFKSRGLTYKETLEIMVLTGWSLDVSSYNDATKTLLYLKIWDLLGDNESWTNDLRTNTYNSFIAQATMNEYQEWVDNIPPQFISIGKNIILKVWEGAKTGVEQMARWGLELFHTLWNEVPLEWKIWAWAAVIATVFIAMRTRYARWAIAGWTTVWTVALAGGLVYMVNNAWASEDFRKDHSEYSNKEEILNAVIQELQNSGIDMELGVQKIRGWEFGWDFDPSKIDTISWSQTQIQESDPLLEADSMQVINSYTEEVWDFKIEKLPNGEVKFFFQGKERHIFFQSELFAPYADTLFTDTKFVKNSHNEVFLAVLIEGNRYKYLSLKEINWILSREEPEVINIAGLPEYLIYEWFYQWWSLYIDGEKIS